MAEDLVVLTAEELEYAKKMWIKEAQKSVRNAIIGNNELFLDENGIWRYKGRLGSFCRCSTQWFT